MGRRAAVIALLAGLFLGLLIGYSIFSVEDKRIDVKFIRGETIRDTCYISIPYSVTFPSYPEYIYHHHFDSNEMVVDTAAILKDWTAQRKYKVDLFVSDTIGSCTVDATVQYNQLQQFSYNYTPIVRQSIVERERIWIPFVSAGAGYLDRAFIKAGGGIFYHNVGIEVNILSDFNHIGGGLSFKYKF